MALNSQAKTLGERKFENGTSIDIDFNFTTAVFVYYNMKVKRFA